MQSTETQYDNLSFLIPNKENKNLERLIGLKEVDPVLVVYEYLEEVPVVKIISGATKDQLIVGSGASAVNQFLDITESLLKNTVSSMVIYILPSQIDYFKDQFALKYDLFRSLGASFYIASPSMYDSLNFQENVQCFAKALECSFFIGVFIIEPAPSMTLVMKIIYIQLKKMQHKHIKSVVVFNVPDDDECFSYIINILSDHRVIHYSFLTSPNISNEKLENMINEIQKLEEFKLFQTGINFDIIVEYKASI